MALMLLQVIAFAAIALYFMRWRAAVRRRNAQSWESLVARLRPDVDLRDASSGGIRSSGHQAAPEEQWQRIHGAAGLWTMYENARVMLEMADYAARNGDGIDRELLATLRSDAMQIRVCVLTALIRYAFSQVNEGICINAQRATASYGEMAARMGQLFEGHGMMVPSFSAAM